jgi:hypothetical protein
MGISIILGSTAFNNWWALRKTVKEVADLCCSGVPSTWVSLDPSVAVGFGVGFSGTSESGTIFSSAFDTAGSF